MVIIILKGKDYALSEEAVGRNHSQNIMFIAVVEDLPFFGIFYIGTRRFPFETVNVEPTRLVLL